MINAKLSEFLGNRDANLPCPPGTGVKSLNLEGEARDACRTWLREVEDGTVFGGTGRGLLVKGPDPLRNYVAGALATSAVVKAWDSYFRRIQFEAVPVLAISTTAYLDLVKTSYGTRESVDAQDRMLACKARFGRANQALNVRLLVLTDLGLEPRRDTSDFPKEELAALLRSRLEQHLPTIITTFLSSTEVIGVGTKPVYGPEFGAMVKGSCPGLEVWS